MQLINKTYNYFTVQEKYLLKLFVDLLNASFCLSEN